MPKARKNIRPGVKPLNLHNKFKLGGRKQNNPAAQLSTQAIVDMLDSATHRPRDKSKLQQTLFKRQVSNTP